VSTEVTRERRLQMAAIRLRFLRGRLGLTQRQLAIRAGVNASEIGMVEAGIRPISPRLLAKLAALDADPRYVTDETDGE
jgi:transcriptional regulator with XRE-family HTH domain